MVVPVVWFNVVYWRGLVVVQWWCGVKKISDMVKKC